MATHRPCVLLFAFVLCLSVLAFFAPSARANPGIIRVKVNGATSGTCGDLTDWSNACGLQYALTTVAVSGDELWVASGTYTPTTGTYRPATFQLRDGIALYGGFAMTETLRSERNIATNLTILSGDIDHNDTANPATSPSQIVGNNSYHVVTGSGTNNTAVLDGFIVTAGQADYNGGGMDNAYGNPTVRNVTFSGNSASSGGGMYNFYCGSVCDSNQTTLTNVTFSGNSASSGGGMWTAVTSPTLTNVTFSGNSAIYGGGMYSYWDAQPTLTNVTFSGNSADQGGGMYNGGAGSPTLTNVTFSGNSANQGGGMWNWMMENNPSRPTITNTILWDNTAPSGSQIFNEGTAAILSISNSVVQDGYAGGTNIITTNPNLGVLQNNGGATQTMALGSGSSAINAANPANCPATDQRGYPRRTANGFCDIGAYEAQPYAFSTSIGSGQTTTIHQAFVSPLQATVLDANSNLLGGVVVTYTVPTSGASAVLASNPRISNASGVISTTATANGIGGAYNVAANFTSGAFPAIWGLTNLKGNTTTTITSSSNPSLLGNTVAFTVTVTSPSGGTPTGTVDFYETTSPTAPPRAPRAPSASQPLVGGIATFTASSLTVGAHNLLAIYGGDTGYNASNSALYPQVVIYPTLYFFLPYVAK